jgi:hypothetical protein
MKKPSSPRSPVFALALLATLVGAPASFAGDAPPGDDGVRGARHGRLAEGRKGRGEKLSEDERGALRERVQQKVQTWLTVELSQRAGLDEKKSLQLGAAIKSHLERRQQARQKKHDEMQKLRALIDGKGADAALKAQMKAVVDQHDREEQLTALLDDTARFLTPTEQAKVVIAFPEVMKDTRRMIRDARRGGRGGGAPGDDDE